jgi:hypothetical protein
MSIHLPHDASVIAADMGWNDESILIHLLGFIREQLPETFADDLARYFVMIADEEVRQFHYAEEKE